MWVEIFKYMKEILISDFKIKTKEKRKKTKKTADFHLIIIHAIVYLSKTSIAIFLDPNPLICLLFSPFISVAIYMVLTGNWDFCYIKMVEKF
jgi:hypothetical protein